MIDHIGMPIVLAVIIYNIPDYPISSIIAICFIAVAASH